MRLEFRPFRDLMNDKFRIFILIQKYFHRNESRICLLELRENGLAVYQSFPLHQCCVCSIPEIRHK